MNYFRQIFDNEFVLLLITIVIVLGCLKAVNVIEVSWFVVTSIVWVPMIIALFAISIIAIGYHISYRNKKDK